MEMEIWELRRVGSGYGAEELAVPLRLELSLLHRDVEERRLRLWWSLSAVAGDGLE